MTAMSGGRRWLGVAGGALRRGLEGKVVQHGTEGWRAQYARILTLLDCKFSDAQLEATRGAAKEYNVPVMERDGMERYVREWGDPFANVPLLEAAKSEQP